MSMQSVPTLGDHARLSPPAMTPLQLPALVAVDMVWPEQSNHHGTLFGGAGLSLLDRQAFILASRIFRGPVVTASVRHLEFIAPAPAGYLVECHCTARSKGRRSCTIGTQLIAENLLTGIRHTCLTGDFVMVSQQAPSVLAADDTLSEPKDTATPPDASYVSVAEIVFPSHANHRGVLHGGPAMAWMAKAGFVAATRALRKTMVMAASDRLDFVAPAYVGDIVEITAQVTTIGQRSVHVAVQMWAQTPETGERRHCTLSTFIYVALKTPPHANPVVTRLDTACASDKRLDVGDV